MRHGTCRVCLYVEINAVANGGQLRRDFYKYFLKSNKLWYIAAGSNTPTLPSQLKIFSSHQQESEWYERAFKRGHNSLLSDSFLGTSLTSGHSLHVARIWACWCGSMTVALDEHKRLLHGQPLLSSLSSWHWSLCIRGKWTSELLWMRWVGYTGGIYALRACEQLRFGSDFVSQYGYRSAFICTLEWQRKDWRKLQTCNLDLQLELIWQIKGREWDV